MLVRGATTVLAVLLSFAFTVPAAAGGSSSSVEDFGSVVAVARPADFPNASLMRADCAFVRRTERPDGSAVETTSCTLSDEPVRIPEFQGTPPSRTFIDEGGPCLWSSDYWHHTDGSVVYADSYRLVVTPAGEVHVRAIYPSTPLECE